MKLKEAMDNYERCSRTFVLSNIVTRQPKCFLPPIIFFFFNNTLFMSVGKWRIMFSDKYAISLMQTEKYAGIYSVSLSQFLDG